jgi:hypothetical protein
MDTGIFPTYFNLYVFSFCRLSALNIAWTDLSVAALNTLCTKLPHSMQRINISGCRKTIIDNRMYISLLSYRTGCMLRRNIKIIFKFSPIILNYNFLM